MVASNKRFRRWLVPAEPVCFVTPQPGIPVPRIMAEIKIESREPSLPPIVSKETLESIHGSESKDDEIEWDASMELALLSAVARCKPVGTISQAFYSCLCLKGEMRLRDILYMIGMHKHFRIVSIQHQFKQRTGKSLSLNEIWERLSAYYGLEALEELVIQAMETNAARVW